MRNGSGKFPENPKFRGRERGFEVGRGRKGDRAGVIRTASLTVTVV